MNTGEAKQKAKRQKAKRQKAKSQKAKRQKAKLSKKSKRMLKVNGYLFHQLRTYKPKDGNAVIYWQCERRRDIGCSVIVHTDVDGKSVRQESNSHTHTPTEDRSEALSVRHGLLSDAVRRPEAAPAALLNEFVTTGLALHLSSEAPLKRAIQRRRQQH